MVWKLEEHPNSTNQRFRIRPYTSDLTKSTVPPIKSKDQNLDMDKIKSVQRVGTNFGKDWISNIEEVDVMNKAHRSPSPSAFPNEARIMTPSKTKEDPFQMWQSVRFRIITSLSTSSWYWCSHQQAMERAWQFKQAVLHSWKPKPQGTRVGCKRVKQLHCIPICSTRQKNK